MATLIPSINSCLSHMISGERGTKALESNLNDDYLLWYDVPIDSKRRQPDFIILYPQQGLFVLEMKDRNLSTIQQMNHQAVDILTDAGKKSV